MININRLTDQELLNLSLAELQCDVKDLLFYPLIKDIEQELKNKNIHITPHYWISTEWFCPDGITGIAFPFYLTHPRLIKLEKKMVGFVEGATKQEFKKYLRHEFGHLIDNAFYLRKSKKRQQLFGHSCVPYPTKYEYFPESNDYVKHIMPYYAQAHPDEDWAETFAIWLTSNNWRRKYQGKARKKIELVEELITNLNRQAKVNQKIVEPLSTYKTTLADYYAEKIMQIKNNGPYFIKHSISTKQKRAPYSTSTSNLKRRFKQIEAKYYQLASKRYGVLMAERFLIDIKQSLNDIKQNFPASDKHLLNLLLEITDEYVKQQAYQVVM